MPMKEPSFAERQQTAAKAKQAQLEKLNALSQANKEQAAARNAAAHAPKSAGILPTFALS